MPRVDSTQDIGGKELAESARVVGLAVAKMNGEKNQPQTGSHSPEQLLLRAIVSAMRQFFLPQQPSTPKPKTFPPRAPRTDGSTDELRHALAGLRGVAPAEITEDILDQIKQHLEKQAEEEADLLARRIQGYLKAFTRLALSAADVQSYMSRERRLLVTMYTHARETRPSPDRLRRLAIQLALDVRKPIVGPIRSIDMSRDATGWRIGDYRGIHPSPALPPPGGFVNAISPLAEDVLPYLAAPEQDIPRLISYIETALGGEPSQAETLEAADSRLLRFQVSKGHVRLWIADTEIKGILTKDEQALLRYFCENPKARFTGPALRKKLGEQAIKNPSQAASRIRKALEAVLPEAVDWLATNPLRWADGVRVLRWTNDRQDPFQNNAK